MPIAFPASPAVNASYTYAGKTWTFNGVGWAPALPAPVAEGFLASTLLAYFETRVDPAANATDLIAPATVLLYL